MPRVRSLSLCLLLLLPIKAFCAPSVIWFDGSSPVSYCVKTKTDAVVKIALEMFASDMQMVTGMLPAVRRNAQIEIYQDAAQGFDAFLLKEENGKIIIRGGNGRGVAYGLLELSRMAGVSPWVWWGDVTPEKKALLTIEKGFSTYQRPSVEYRGIFLNDEDWTCRNWSYKTHEPSYQFGHIGPATYKRIFQLLLRLRANAIWPAMHTGTPAFFSIEGNKEMADSCGIVVGTSHCEPLLRNNVEEWNHAQRGNYNFISNRQQVVDYWSERLKQTRGSEYLYTIGMRGIHDGSMEGVSKFSMKKKAEVLQEVIDTQRELLRKYVAKDVTKVPQVFIPYKEVLEIMEAGMDVPEDVTLMWCDDNYGYLTRLSDSLQQQRRGGAGVYYHLSYWGRPHDYLWLTTTQPGLIYSEMKAAYDHNARKLWIANVHDPKVAAYDLEFFLDMAWDINSIQPDKISQHLCRWLTTQFGTEAAGKLLPAMADYYRLCGIRKPEFMGWTQVELDKKVYPRGRSQVRDTEFTNAFGNELERFLDDYQRICQTVTDAENLIRPELNDAYFAAIKYPVICAADMAIKMLQAQKARSAYLGQTDKTMNNREERMLLAASKSLTAYKEIQQLTDYYNNALADGKWRGSMNCAPRDLYVFFPPLLPALTDQTADIHAEGNYHPISTDGVMARNAADYTSASARCTPISMLGHSMKAVPLPKGEQVSYDFSIAEAADFTLYTALIPTQPNDKGDLRYEILIDGESKATVSLKEPFRSERWKQNVLRGQALHTTPVTLSAGHHTITIKALDDHIVIDQWMLDPIPDRKFYLIPTKPEINALLKK